MKRCFKILVMISFSLMFFIEGCKKDRPGNHPLTLSEITSKISGEYYVTSWCGYAVPGGYHSFQTSSIDTFVVRNDSCIEFNQEVYVFCGDISLKQYKYCGSTIYDSLIFDSAFSHVSVFNISCSGSGPRYIAPLPPTGPPPFYLSQVVDSIVGTYIGGTQCDVGSGGHITHSSSNDTISISIADTGSIMMVGASFPLDSPVRLVFDGDLYARRYRFTGHDAYYDFTFDSSFHRVSYNNTNTPLANCSGQAVR